LATDSETAYPAVNPVRVEPLKMRQIRKNTFWGWLAAGMLLVANGAYGQSQQAIQIRSTGSDVLQSNTNLIATLQLQNNAAAPIDANLEWTLRLNSDLYDTLPPDSELGLDHAVNASSSISVDGKEYGDALLTDNDPYTAFETPWTNGLNEGTLVIELDRPREIRQMQWMAGDANWIWKTDVSSSSDGIKYDPIVSLQGFDLNKKWGQNSFPLSQPVTAKFLRFRLYRDNGDKMNVLRLPSSIHIFDGSDNDTITPPNTGAQIASGKITTSIASKQSANLEIKTDKPLAPGCYLLSWQTASSSKPQIGWSQLLVKPTDSVDKNLTRRFGINSSNMALTPAISECGFGWVRFENGKWIMSSDAPDHYSFDGKLGPWHVNQDLIYQTYHEHNMLVMPYVFQTPEWANSASKDITVNRAGYPPRKAEDYGDAIYQFVARFGSKKVDPKTLKTDDKKSGLNEIDAIELWNEPNLVGPAWAAFVGPIEQYFEVMRAGAKGARLADPDLLVTSCGWAGTELATLKQMTDYRYDDGTCPLDLVDIINVHFYSGRQDPETALEDPNVRKQGSKGPEKTYIEQLTELKLWRDEHKPSAKIWVTETGNDVGGPIGLSERKQAAKLPRVSMITLAEGIDKVFIYRESGSDPSMHAGAGLVRNDNSLRPAWFTMATMMRQMQGFEGKATRLPHSDPNVWLLHWKNEQKSMVAAWTIGEPITILGTQLLVGQPPKSGVDSFGHEIDLTKSIELSEFPKYIRY
jgi:hypothetical protein